MIKVFQKRRCGTEMPVTRKQNENFDIVRGECLLIDVVENNKIGKILLHSVWTSGVDYLVREQTDSSNLVGKRFVREIGKEIHFNKVVFFVKFLEPRPDIRL